MRVVILLLLLATGIVRAESESEAQRLLAEGTRLFTEDASFEAARDAFARSFELEPSWRALNGIALVEQQQGKLVQALATYEKLIGQFDAILSDAQRSTVATRITGLQAKISTVEVSARQPAAVTLDTDDLGTGPLRVTKRVLPGRHVFFATLAGYQSLTRAIVLVPGERRVVDLELVPERVVVKVEQVPLRRRFHRSAPWVVGASGAALIIVGGFAHALAGHDFDRFDASVAAASGSPPMSVPGDPSLRDRAILERRIAYGAYTAGGLAVIVGAVLLAVNQPRPVDARVTTSAVQLVPVHAGIGVSVRF
ncbi:MAG: hypothetical protein H0V17_26880 [Deltaproteobacteria bacterium]|nr:hypothetical protein [Deltaproteobacteria bacterium]